MLGTEQYGVQCGCAAALWTKSQYQASCISSVILMHASLLLST